MKHRETFSKNAQRYLDREGEVELDERERRTVDRLRDAVAGYADDLELLDDSVDAATMQAITQLGAPRRAPFSWRWLLRPRIVQLRPAFVAAAFVAVVFASSVITLVVQNRMSTPPAAGAIDSQTILVRFELSAPDAQRVTLTGTFNDWNESAISLRKSDETGLWVTTIPLPLGRHEYSFVVDSERWVPDPLAHALVDDGFGNVNSVIVVGPRGVSTL